MRYTRLRKAVEAGHFKGATLTQPNPVPATLSQLANPQSRRIGNVPQFGEQQEHHPTEPQEDNPGRTLRARSARPVNLVEEEEEEEEEVIEESENDRESGYSRKRRGSTTKAPPGDHDLFFPDTSESFRTPKKTKRSDSDSEKSEQGDQGLRRSTRSTRAVIQQPTSSKATPQTRARRQATHQRGSVNNKLDVQEASAPPVSAPNTMHALEQNRNTIHQPTEVSRKKQSANTAAEAAYNVGIRTGRWAPHPDDGNTRVHTTAYHPTASHANHLAYVGQGVHSPPAKSAWRDTGADGSTTNFDGINPQLNRATNPYQPRDRAAYHHNAYGHTPNPFSAAPSGTPIGPAGPSYQLHTQHNPDSQPQSQFPARPSPRRYDPTDPNRFHPASVFEGFHAPTALSYSPSSLAGTSVKKNGELSLLQKIKMQRETDKQPMADQTPSLGKAENKKAVGSDNSGPDRKRASKDR